MSAIPIDAIDPEVVNQIMNENALKRSEAVLFDKIALRCSNKAHLDMIDNDVAIIVEYFKENDYIESYIRWTHWRKGLNDELPLDIGWLRNNTSITEAEEKNEGRFQFGDLYEPGGLSIYRIASTKPDGEPPTTFWKRWTRVICIAFELLNNEIDLLASVGTTELESEGEFTISRSGDLFDISGFVNHKIEDTFDFNAGEKFHLLPGLMLKLAKPMVEADDLNLLELCRGAKPFKQNAYWQKTLKAKGTLDELKTPYDSVWIWTFESKIDPF